MSTEIGQGNKASLKPQIEFGDTQIIAQLAWLPPAGESARVNAALNAQILESARAAA